MSRPPRSERLNAIYRTIQQNPGQVPASVARQLNLNRSEVTRALPALEERGLLLSEDEKGRLFPYTSPSENNRTGDSAAKDADER